MSDEDWVQCGRDISNNCLDKLSVREGVLDDRTMTLFFQGLTRSSSLNFVELIENGFGVAGAQSMVPFLRNSKSLKTLFVVRNTIRSEGFNALWRALRDSPIEKLYCPICGINAIEIDMDDLPKQLVHLNLNKNDINTDDCRELAKVLRGEKSTLRELLLGWNRIDDEGVAILASALQKNTSLERLHLDENEGMTTEGLVLLLTLVCDISSIKATLQSNHTLIDFGDVSIEGGDCLRNDLSDQITHVLAFNQNVGRLKCGERKVIAFHLQSKALADMCRLQRVEQNNAALYGQINPLCLPEVLALIKRFHGQTELYLSLRSSIMTLLSTVDRERCLQQRLSYHMAIVEKHAAIAEELRVEIATLARANCRQVEVEGDQEPSTKKRRLVDE
mmetsp:Transcript_29002/g.43575  ORF Transcript_29002/g.43575 Transcript_29002/m.43575 type:complete len:390 (+) Transcript_29002:3-1172(+)